MTLHERLSTLTLPAPFGEPEPGDKRAAVAIIYDATTVLMIRRAGREGDPWSGDMAFPGGRAEPVDADSVHTALRETHEEVGLVIPRTHLVGALPVQRSPVRRPELALTVFPFAFRVESFGDMTLSNEVASTHLLSIAGLFDPQNRGTFRYQGWGVDRELPCVRLDGTFIWGLSLRMLDTLGEACGLPAGEDWPR